MKLFEVKQGGTLCHPMVALQVWPRRQSTDKEMPIQFCMQHVGKKICTQANIRSDKIRRGQACLKSSQL